MTPCRIYQGVSDNGNGYPMTTRWVDGKKQSLKLANKTWEDAHGPIPDGLWVLHTCDNRRCYELRHLYLGTPSRNVQDSIERGRWANGNSRKTECKYGHPFDESNTIITARGQRECQQCKRRRLKDYRQRRASREPLRGHGEGLDGSQATNIAEEG